ncbi:MAG: hypothetical protein OHK0015_18230 [Chloroflexi bacterium OHK40]
MSRRAVLMEALAATQSDLERLARRLDPATAARRPAPESWSVAEVVAHMAEIEARYRDQLRQTLIDDHPTLSPLVPDEAAHDTLPLPELVAAFVAARAATLALLAEVPQGDWGRPLTHPTLGSTRFRELVQALVSHDNEHLAQIAAIREQLP